MYGLIIVYMLATGKVQASDVFIYPSKDACEALVSYAQGIGDGKMANGAGTALVYCTQAHIVGAQSN